MTTKRTTVTVETTTVRHVATPQGKDRENGPHLGDLRAFVAACGGLDDGLVVRIDTGSLDEGGRHNVTFTVVRRVNKDT